MNPVPSPACRLSILLAASSPVAVVLRRGPTRWTQLWKWHTDTDLFEPGQWFKGRIYDRRCDVSPDGELFIYFASKFNEKTLRDRDYTYAWTAVSRPPYFTALALWPKGDCWHGGGLFRGPRHVWLNHTLDSAVPHPKHRPRGLRVDFNPDAHGEDWPVWSARMQRNGWTLIQDGAFESMSHGWRTVQPEIWERKNPARTIVLRRSTDAINYRHPSGKYVESFRLLPMSGGEIPLPNATWADWDHAGRLIFTRDGKIFQGRIESNQVIETELTDLNDRIPEPIRAPESARIW